MHTARADRYSHKRLGQTEAAGGGSQPSVIGRATDVLTGFGAIPRLLPDAQQLIQDNLKEVGFAISALAQLYPNWGNAGMRWLHASGAAEQEAAQQALRLSQWQHPGREVCWAWDC